MNENTALGGKSEDPNDTNFLACTALKDKRKLRGLVYQDTPFWGKRYDNEDEKP